MLWRALSQVARERAAHQAIVSDEASISYGQLTQHVEALADALRTNGVGPGHVVLAHLENVPAFLVALLAINAVGATFAPLEPSLTDHEILAVLDLCSSDVVVCTPAALPRCQVWSRNVLSIDESGAFVSAHVAQRPAAALAHDVACMQFSSGTTGSAKGILLGHEAFLHRSLDLSQALGLTGEDRTLCALPLSHPHGAECLALPTLLAGGTLFLKSPRFAFPLYIIEELAKQRITFFSSIPQFYDFAVRLDQTITPDLTALRLPFCGSAALSQATAEAFFARFGVHIHQGYGLAELAVICVNMHQNGQRAYDSVGKPLPGIAWKLEGDSDTHGELCVRSRAMFSGYIHDEAGTRERIRDGFLHTGDIVTVDASGLFRIVGRKEDFVKVNGLKIFASELELAIISLPFIAECAVLAEKDALGSESLTAHVVARDAALSQADVQRRLLSELRTLLADYKLPRRCVVWPELPKNALGKVLKSKLRDQPERSVP